MDISCSVTYKLYSLLRKIQETLNILNKQQESINFSPSLNEL